MKLYLQLWEGMLREYNLLRQYCLDNNIDCENVSLKKVQRNQINFNNLFIAHGSVEFIQAVLKRYDCKIPVIDSYPDELKEYLYRYVVRKKLKDLYNIYACFIKPYDRIKLWTGKVFEGNEIDELQGQFNGNTEIYCSEIVIWKSEWRYYVLRNNIVAYANYDGDPNIQPDIDIVREAIGKIKNPGSAYCLDFGILSSGQTALIEINDAWSFGWYLDNRIDIYYSMIKERFLEMMFDSNK